MLRPHACFSCDLAEMVGGAMRFLMIAEQRKTCVLWEADGADVLPFRADHACFRAHQCFAGPVVVKRLEGVERPSAEVKAEHGVL